MKALRMIRLMSVVAVAVFVVGCGVEEPAPEATASESNPWLVVEVDAIKRGWGVRNDAVPESLAMLHERTERSFVDVAHVAGPQRMIRFETKHGTIPNQERWGNDVRYHFAELDGRMSATTQWELTNLQLVGLVKQPHGAVYQIPAQGKVTLEKLKDFPTRNLDEFEHTALKQLQEGKNVIAYVENDRTRMLGAIRLTADCKACHQQPEGTLLGAFTYDLKRDPRPYTPPPAKAKQANDVVAP